MALAGCGHAASPRAKPKTAGPRAVSASVLAVLRATVTAAEAVPAYANPGPAVSAATVEGRSALVMPINSQISSCQTQASDFEALGKQLGMYVTLFADSGQPSQWEQGIEDGISARDAAIVLVCGIMPGAIGPQLAAAEKAGAVVVDTDYNGASDYRYLDGETAVESTEGLTDDVDDAFVALGGRALHAVFIGSDSIVQGPAAEAAVDNAIKDICPSACTFDAINVPIQDWTTAVQSDVSSALAAHPDTNAVFVGFDGMATYAAPAVQASHIKGLEIYTWGGSANVEELLQNANSVIAADPGPDEQWDAYEAMDQVIRLLNHDKAAPLSAEIDPNRFWVSSNVSSFFGPNHSYGNAGFGGDAFVKGFDTLWGLPVKGS